MRAFAEGDDEKQGSEEGGEGQQQAGLHHGEIAKEQEDPDQGSDEGPDIVHLEDAGEVAAHVVGELLVDAGEQGDFEADQDPDGADESVLGEDEMRGEGTEYVQHGKRTETAEDCEPDLAVGQHIDHFLVGDVALDLGAQSHAEEHDGDDDCPLLDRIAEDVGSQLAERVLVGHAAAAHDEHDQSNDEGGYGAGAGRRWISGGIRSGFHR